MATMFILPPAQSLAEFYGTRGFTVVFAFSTDTGKYGWGYNLNQQAAAATALQECGPGAQIVGFQKDGWLCLVWDGNRFAYGHSIGSAQNAYGHAMESFEKLHGGQPSRVECRSSDGNFIPVRNN